MSKTTPPPQTDDELVTGMTGFGLEPKPFANAEPTKDQKDALSQELALIEAALPSVKTQIAWIDDEVSKLIDLRDFVPDLRAMPSELPEEQVRNKLELRFVNVNQLLAQKTDIVNRMESVGKDVTTKPIARPVVQGPIRIVTTEFNFEPRPYGIKAVWQGICDIFRGSPM